MNTPTFEIKDLLRIEESTPITVNGVTKWKLPDGKLHRVHGPAIENSAGDKWWFKHGKRHREDGPALEFISGRRSYFVNGKRHREDGPAIERADGSVVFYLNGILMTEKEYWIAVNSKR